MRTPRQGDAAFDPPGPVEPLLEIDDWVRLTGRARRTVERDIAVGRIPPPDLRLGRQPRWRSATYRRWEQGGGK